MKKENFVASILPALEVRMLQEAAETPVGGTGYDELSRIKAIEQVTQQIKMKYPGKFVDRR